LKSTGGGQFCDGCAAQQHRPVPAILETMELKNALILISTKETYCEVSEKEQ